MSTGHDPILSVVIPVWNGERYLADAITSVLEQRGAPPLELIVVDDGSEDRSAAIAEHFGPPVRCVRISHGGLAAARNAGVAAALGRYLTHHDSDDLLPPESLSVRMAAFEGDAAPELVLGQVVAFVSPELGSEEAARFRLPAGAYRAGVCGSVMRREFATQVGTFDVSKAHGCDLDWMARAMEHGAPVVAIPNVVQHRRIHGANMSLSDPGTDRLAILRTRLNRRRAAEADPDSRADSPK